MIKVRMKGNHSEPGGNRAPMRVCGCERGVRQFSRVSGPVGPGGFQFSRAKRAALNLYCGYPFHSAKPI